MQISLKTLIASIAATAVVSLAAGVVATSDTRRQGVPSPASAQATAPVAARAIAAPPTPLPSEAASATIGKFSFVVYGDTRGRRDGVQEEYEHSLVVDGVLAAIKRQALTPYPIRFVLQTGDAVSNGRDGAQWNTSFDPIIDRLTLSGGVPYFLVAGNHDVTSATELTSRQRQDGVVNFLSAMDHLLPPAGSPRRLDGYPTYSFGYGNTFVLVIDSNIASDQVQWEWAQRQLDALDRSRYVNVFAAFHHPPFSSGPHGGARVEAQAQAIRDLYLPLFRKHRVRLMLCGHDHLFEHWVERYVDAAGPQRMDEIVTGGGGAPLYAYSGEPDTSDYLRKNAEAKVRLEHLVKPGMSPGDNPYHFVLVQVDGTSIHLEVVGIDWGAGFKPYRSSGASLDDR